MHKYLLPLTFSFEQSADPDNAGPMEKYMRNQFSFLGIKSPAQKSLVRQFVAENGLPALADLESICHDLWALPAREYQYAGMDLLHRMRRKLTPNFVPLVEYLITTKSWWDTVDGLASHAVGGLFERFPAIRDQHISRWRKADDFWLRRTTLLFQLRYKDKTDEALLFSLVLENKDSKEFFIQKAIGWALREYSKTNGTAVETFVSSHQLAPLSRREALKWLKR